MGERRRDVAEIKDESDDSDERHLDDAYDPGEDDRRIGAREMLRGALPVARGIARIVEDSADASKMLLGSDSDIVVSSVFPNAVKHPRQRRQTGAT